MEKPNQSFAIFYKRRLPTEMEVEAYMADIGISYYQQLVEVVVDAKNTKVNKLNKNHKMFKKIIKAKSRGATHFRFYVILD